jgi:hypothetical protein
LKTKKEKLTREEEMGLINLKPKTTPPTNHMVFKPIKNFTCTMECYNSMIKALNMYLKQTIGWKKSLVQRENSKKE